MLFVCYFPRTTASGISGSYLILCKAGFCYRLTLGLIQSYLGVVMSSFNLVIPSPPLTACSPGLSPSPPLMQHPDQGLSPSPWKQHPYQVSPSPVMWHPHQCYFCHCYKSHNWTKKQCRYHYPVLPIRE